MMKHLTIAGAALAAAGLAAPQPAEAATYFVRTAIQDGPNTLYDGIQENGPTSFSDTVVGDFGEYEGAVDLNDGTVKVFADVVGAGAFGQSGGSFGERLAFSPNAAGTSVDFSFAFDGDIEVSDPSQPSILIDAGLYVFEAGSGADYTNFAGAPGALISQRFTDSSFDTLTQGSFSIDETLFGSITLAANTEYDVFASLSVASANNANDVSVTLDFLNTGTFGIVAAPGVSYTSLSGAFLDSTGITPPAAVVPVPAALPLLLGGLGLLGFVGRRRRAAAA